MPEGKGYEFEVDVDGESVPLWSPVHPDTLDQEMIGELVKDQKGKMERGVLPTPEFDLYDEYGRIYPHWFDSSGRFTGLPERVKTPRGRV